MMSKLGTLIITRFRLCFDCIACGTVTIITFPRVTIALHCCRSNAVHLYPCVTISAEYDGAVYGMAGGAFGHGMDAPEYPLFGGGGGGGGSGGGSDGEYQQTGSLVVDGGDHFSVSAAAFDHQEELLWMGNSGVSGPTAMAVGV